MTRRPSRPATAFVRRSTGLRQALRPSGAEACLLERADRLGLRLDASVECDVRRVQQLWAEGDERALTELLAGHDVRGDLASLARLYDLRAWVTPR